MEKNEVFFLNQFKFIYANFAQKTLFRYSIFKILDKLNIIFYLYSYLVYSISFINFDNLHKVGFFIDFANF